MKIFKNIKVMVLLIVLFVISVGIIMFLALHDSNKLTIKERNYINNMHSKLLDVHVLNDINVFGQKGQGVFYDFLSYLETEQKLKFNKIALNNNGETGLSFAKNTTLPENAKLIYTDHFVLISKNFKIVLSPHNINGTIGIINRDINIINQYISPYNLTIRNYNTKEELEAALSNGEVDFILVPRIEYFDTYLSNLYNIVYHFSDIKEYYYMGLTSDEVLNSILEKYFNIWNKENFEESFYKNEYSLFTNKLKITEKELDVINSKEYIYGFMENAPYDIMSSGSYGGIMNKYLDKFSQFSGIVFNYKEYSKASKFNKDISKGKINLYVDYYNLNSNYVKLDSLHYVDISFLMSNKDKRTYTTITSLMNEPVYVKEDSIISKYLENIGIKILTYKSNRELKKILKNNGIVAMDYAEYLLYKVENKNISERFRINTNHTYNFASNNDSMFNRLFTYFVNSLDREELIYTGIDNYMVTATSGRLAYVITKYTLILILAIASISYIVYLFGKRIRFKKRIKKADKMKYIDILTSLKNRNFLNENIAIWNQNTIYPQAIVVIDLNSVQELNDTYGYSEGDKQIQALANILIKTQVDNTEMIRTDGNEFTIYMIGYNEKQVLSYIKKINKELKNLPHDKGAAIGFSMIEDDVKLIDDAINEATEMMRKNKELMYGEEYEEKI